MSSVKRTVTFLFLLLIMMPVAFADLIGPNYLIDFPLITFFFLFVNFAWNLLVVFSIQRIFLKDFLSKMHFSEILNLLAMITFFGLVGDAICVLGGLNLEPAFFSYLFCALPIVILEFNYLARKTTIKNAGILALSLGLLANPILGITVLESLSVQFQVNIAMVLFGLLIVILAAAVLYHLWKKEKQPEKSKQALLWLTIALIVFVLSAIFLLFTSAG